MDLNKLSPYITKMIYTKHILKLIYYKTALFFISRYYQMKWSLRNPWCIARANIAYSKYMDTIMYEERIKIFDEKFAFITFVENKEILYFIRKFTLKDKIKMYLTPFSCTGRYKICW